MPIPKRQWKKIGGELPSHYVEGDQLIIPKIKGGDAGEYVCIAANSKGTAEDRFILRTTGLVTDYFFFHSYLLTSQSPIYKLHF